MGQFISNFYGKASTYLQERQGKLKTLTENFSAEEWKTIGESAVSMTDWKRENLSSSQKDRYVSLYNLFLEAGYTKDDIKKIHVFVTQASDPSGILLKILKGQKVCEDPKDDQCRVDVKNLFAFRSARRTKKEKKASPKKSKKLSPKKVKKASPKKSKKAKKSKNKKSVKKNKKSVRRAKR